MPTAIADEETASQTTSVSSVLNFTGFTGSSFSGNGGGILDTGNTLGANVGDSSLGGTVTPSGAGGASPVAVQGGAFGLDPKFGGGFDSGAITYANGGPPNSTDAEGGQGASFFNQPVLASYNGGQPPSATNAAYNGEFHDYLVNYLATQLQLAGGRAITNVDLFSVFGSVNGTYHAIADMLVLPPGGSQPFFVEVKTGDNPQFTPDQRAIYPLLQIGDHVESPRPDIVQFGLTPGQPLPPINVFIIYSQGPGQPIKGGFLPPPQFDP